MADDWADASAPKVSRVKNLAIDEDEDSDVKDNWDESSESEPEPEPPKPEPKKQNKPAAPVNLVDTSAMTAKEREDYARAQELASMMDTFGTSDGTANGGDDFLSLDSVQSRDEFNDLAERIATKLKTKSKSDNYRDFLQTLFVKLCDPKPKHVRFIGNVLLEKAKAQQEAEKEKKKPKTKAKASIKVGKKDDLYSDVIGAEFGGAADASHDFDDFM